MINRIPEALRPSLHEGQPSQSGFGGLRDLAEKHLGNRIRQVKTFVQEHPAAGIGAALFLGVVLGWVIKRK